MKKEKNKKIKLVIMITAFVIILCGITAFYYGFNLDKSKEELEQQAAKIGVVKVTDDSFKSEVLDSKVPVVAEFSSNMCPPCISMLPTMISLAKNNDDIKVVTINVDDENTNDTSKEYDISSTPTIMIFKEGKVIKTFIGATSEKDILSYVKS